MMEEAGPTPCGRVEVRVSGWEMIPYHRGYVHKQPFKLTLTLPLQTDQRKDSGGKYPEEG